MAERLTFTLAGRDELSRVLDGTADSADRLRLRLAGITTDADGNLRDLQGRFLTLADAQRRVDDTTGQVRRSMADLSDASGKLGESIKANLISLLPAAIPAAAGLASSAAAVAAQLGAGAVAAGAYALALGPQIGKISEAAEAQEKYEEALATSGAGSAEAGKAALEYERRLAALTPETRDAAVAVGLLKDNYDQWSDSLSGDVMAPFTKGVAVANALLPETTGLVKGASTQFDRLITLVAGGISTPGFDAMNQKFTTFATDTLDNGIDKLTVFLAKVQSGEYDGGGVAEFFDWAQAQGPVVWDTLENIGEALFNVLEAGADVGVGMLDVVNVLSEIVSAVPPEAIATILQLAIAIKAVKLAAAGGAAASAAVAALGVQIGAMRVAAAGAPGALAGAGAAITGLSRTAKLAVAGTGLGLLLITLDALSAGSQKPKPDVDALSTSLTELAQSGKVSGEAMRVYGGDLSGLGDAIQKVVDPKGLDQVQQSIVSFFGMDSTPVKQAKEDLSAFDEALADMVSSGNADMAAEALARTIEQLEAQGQSTDGLRDKLTAYNDALAGQALEQELAAQSMGIFGAQALAVQDKLDAQKQSADGLRQSIIALNDANRSAYDAQIGFEAGLDALTESFAQNGATLDLNTESGRANGQAMSAAAKAHDEMLASGLAAGESLASMTGKSETLRAKMLELASATGMSDREAQEYVNTLLGTPEDIRTNVILERQDAIAGLNNVQTEIERTPDSHTVTVDTLNAAAIAALEAVGLKTRRLPDGRTEVYTANGQAIGSIGAVDKALRNLDGDNASTTVTNTIVTQYVTKYLQGRSQHDIVGATGGLYTGDGFKTGYSVGGRVKGPGTGTSDDVPAPWLSNGEFVIREAMVDRYGEDLFHALNSGSMPAWIGRAAPSPGRPAAATAPTAGPSQGTSVSYNIYPQKSVIDARDVELITRQEEARMRVGRPR
ncbi:PspA/IM30 family protein [Streptomyces sp. NPDC058534]|uniref:PspA/IM30 family protein n=1 Tax=Streptomyces sp. NPDC058534 TaxID=3346541 RepID=UPI003669B006